MFYITFKKFIFALKTVLIISSYHPPSTSYTVLTDTFIRK